MPLYEYECTQCKRHTEKIQKFSDPEITECPHCGGPLERVLHAPAISFKGGGWFKDGYGNTRPKASDSSKSDSGKASGSAGDISASSKSDSASGSSAAAATPAPAPSSSSEKK